jgi:NADH-quinone oxidoreductase subunit H
MKFALFFLGEYAAMIAVRAMMVVLFLGGWPLPFAGLNETAESLGMGLLQVGIFIGKLLLFMGLFIWVRWMLPRFRYDQLMDIGWKRFVPLALANIVVTAIYLYLTHGK